MARQARVAPLLSGVLVGSALAAGALTAGVAPAAEAGTVASAPGGGRCPEAREARQDVAEARRELDRARTAVRAAEAVYRRKNVEVTRADAASAAAPRDEKLRAAASRASSERLVALSRYLNLLNRSQTARAELLMAQARADGVACPDRRKPNGQRENGPRENGPREDGSRENRPGPRPTPGHAPLAVSVVPVSASSATVVAPGPIDAPASVGSVAGGDGGVPAGDRHDGGFAGWFGDADDSSGGAPGAGSAPVADRTGEVDGSFVPLGTVDGWDGSGAGPDMGHIGLAVAGLGALGLAGAGTAGVAGRRRRQRT